MKKIKIFFYLYFFYSFRKIRVKLSFKELNFRKLDFTNYSQIKTYIFKKNFTNMDYKYVHNFDFLSFSTKIGGSIGVNLSKEITFGWFKIYKSKIDYPWSSDLISKRLINLIYNYDFIEKSSTKHDLYKLDKIIYNHLNRGLFFFNNKKINEITSYDLIANALTNFLTEKMGKRVIFYYNLVVKNQIDFKGMHKSYNLIEHSKFINNLNELKNIFLYFNYPFPEEINEQIIKMKTVQNQYFHLDGSIPLFNGANNIFTKIIYDSLNKDDFFKVRDFQDIKNGIALYADRKKRLFFDVVQPKNEEINNNLSAGTLSLELSSDGEKIITNCGASDIFGKNPEYLRYSAAHSTVILQNTNISEIKENNPHLNYPQSVTFQNVALDNGVVFEGSHNGYRKKYNKIIKRKIFIEKNNIKIIGEDSIIPTKVIKLKVVYHIRFHLVDGFSFNFTNSKKNIILRSKNNKMWIFKSNEELIIEDSILVDNNKTKSTKQIVIKGVVGNNKIIKKWSIEKI